MFKKKRKKTIIMWLLLLWQEKVCHLMDIDEAKSDFVFIPGVLPEGGDESEDSQVAWDQ